LTGPPCVYAATCPVYQTLVKHPELRISSAVYAGVTCDGHGVEALTHIRRKDVHTLMYALNSLMLELHNLSAGRP
jgi:hypothetical protein